MTVATARTEPASTRQVHALAVPLLLAAAEADWQEILDRQGAQFLVLEYDIYQKDRGYSDLIDQVKAAPGRWQAISERPVFVARRLESPRDER